MNSATSADTIQALHSCSSLGNNYGEQHFITETRVILVIYKKGRFVFDMELFF